MDSGLVDLSLFAYAPAADNHFSNINRTNRHNLYTTATWPESQAHERLPTIQTSAMKPLPKAPRRNIYDLCLPSTGSKCVLKRIRRVKLDNVRCDHRRQLQARTPSAYASAPSAYINPVPTVEHQYQSHVPEERWFPTPTQPSVPSDNVIMPGSGLPMIWLPDEQMWLVADPTDPGYGYYATGPEHGEEWLPPYTENESPASEASQSDLSPVREQFMSLMDPTRLQRPPTLNPDEPQMSPLFQEALTGIGMLNFNESSDYTVPSPNLFSQPKNRNAMPYREANNYTRGYLDPQHIPHNPTNNSWNSRPSRWESRPRTPRAESPALRADTAPMKYYTEGEMQRQKERTDRRRMVAQRQTQQREAYSGSNAYHQGYVPYGHARYYQPSGLSRRESWHSDSCASAVSTVVSPDTMWPVRASSARH